MFGAGSVLLRMNKSAQVGGAQAKRSTAQTQHDKIGGRNDVDDILFAYGVLRSSTPYCSYGIVTRRLPTVPAYTRSTEFITGG